MVLLATAMTACSANPRPEQPVDPDVGLTATALNRESEALARVDATIAARPLLERRLADARAAHAAHVALLRTTDLPTPTSSASPGVTDPVPPARSLLEVAASEEVLRNRHLAAAMTARSGELARLLASMSASSAQISATLRVTR